LEGFKGTDPRIRGFRNRVGEVESNRSKILQGFEYPRTLKAASVGISRILMDVPWPFQAKQRLFGKWTHFLKFSFRGLWDLKILYLLSHVDKSRNEKYSKGRQWSASNKKNK